MFDRILNQICEKIRNRQYVVTFHARKEMNNDELTIYDVEHAILTGEILERQTDRVTSESKYRIRGDTFADDKAEVIGKLSPTGKLVIITVYLLYE
ncbi:MAG: DUF4258 domain-containing protein [Candidatus Aminicenantes bacterium]|nr:DUF4258 domain-containing protein [Candidatus Aminicenantes bacterium]